MRCCVPFCNNTSDNVSTSEGEGKRISFHPFPSEVHLRAAWLRALGRQDNLPDSAVVCSLHFLDEDIYETESGLRLICTGAIPSTVQVCMICLDTDSKMLLMSKHNLDEEYKKLTGHPLCDQGNLKLTLCVQCAWRLINFSRFRDKSLRACALMMDLVGKHELITKEHIKMINRTKHQLSSNMVLTTLGPDHCDLHILEDPSEDNQKKLEETRLEGIMKTEGNDEHMWIDEDMEMVNENYNNVIDFVRDPLKYESATFQCTLCLEEFVHEHAYMQHMSMHLQDGDGECKMSQVCKPHTAVSSSSAHSSLITDNKQAERSLSAHSAQTLVAPLSARLAVHNENKEPANEDTDSFRERKPVFVVNNYLIDSQTSNTNYERNRNLNTLTNRAVKLDNVFKKPKKDVTQNIASKDVIYHATNQNDVPKTGYVEPVIEEVKVILAQTVQSKTVPLKNVINVEYDNSLQNSTHIEKRGYICDICRKMYKRKRLLVKHIKNHAEVRRFTCNICQYKCKHQNAYKSHMKTHTDCERPFACKLCNYKCALKSDQVRHMRTHTGIKPFSCKLCDYKCIENSYLVKHMRTHSGERRFSCKLCDYKCKKNSHLVTHMRIHSGTKPFSCELCDYQCTQNSNLVKHMRTHTGIKPFSCKFCDYKCAQSSSLVTHMRTHTDERPFSCMLCDYKSRTNSHLVTHIRTHTGIKPFSCELCEYKCVQNSSLVKHMRTHTGVKPFSCELCDYKCTENNSLVKHMRTHTGVKPFSCELCDYKCRTNSDLVSHMRTHTGEKPFSCKICENKYGHSSSLMKHMRTHAATDEQPSSCS